MCVVDIFSKYGWVAPLKDKKDIAITDRFQKILNKSGRTPWAIISVDKGNEFYNKWLQDNNIEIYSTYNKGRCIVAEKFVRTLKNKFNKYASSISKNVYIDKLGDIAKTYNNAYYRII